MKQRKSLVDNESFLRWQGRTIEQLSSANNVFIGLASGLLAYLLQLVLGSSLANYSFYIRGSLLLGCVFLFTSVLAGCLLMLNRLSSFRLTAKISKSRNELSSTEIDKLRTEVDKLDSKTWAKFRLQIATFALGGLSILFSIVVLIFKW